LFPRMSAGPCVLVRSTHAGVSFTDGFVALRPVRPGEGVLLWGVLSSESGILLRQSIASGTVGGGVAIAQLFELPIQLPPLSRAGAIERCLPSAGSDQEAEQTRRTTWTTLDATDGRWGNRFETLGLGYAPALSLMRIASVRPGSVNAKERVELPLPGCLPVCLPEHVRADRWAPSAWAAPSKARVSGAAHAGGSNLGHQPASHDQTPDSIASEKHGSAIAARHQVTTGGELLLPAVYRFLPAIAPSGWLVGRDVFAIMLDNPERAEALAAWLRGKQGQTVLQRVVSGQIVPRLTLRALRELPLPHDFSEEHRFRVQQLETRLALRLQDALQ